MSNTCQYHGVIPTCVRHGCSPRAGLYGGQTSRVKNWAHAQIKTFLKIRRMLCLQNINLIPNRILLITNTIFKHVCPYQELGKVSHRVIYMLIKYSVIKRFTAVTEKYLHINEILTGKDIVRSKRITGTISPRQFNHSEDIIIFLKITCSEIIGQGI